LKESLKLIDGGNAMNIYTVIPARGGSKSIPKKNIKPLYGKPLIGYSIEYSLKCPLVAHTIVSTDSEEIAEIARNCGAEVPFNYGLRLGLCTLIGMPIMIFVSNLKKFKRH
jgi:hypothetical protein|tara:strand:+ start:55 stop:387 length:333 start_codon:yes stop_codon:yes gene_type:complete